MAELAELCGLASHAMADRRRPAGGVAFVLRVAFHLIFPCRGRLSLAHGDAAT